MRMTELFGRTLRDVPAGVEGAGYQILLRAGYIRTADFGLGEGRDRYAYLPLAKRSLDRLAAALAFPTDGRSPADVELPALHGSDPLTLAAGLAGSDIQSYRQLPVRARARGIWLTERGQGRGGPLNAGEAPMALSVTLDEAEESAQAAYRERQSALLELCRRCGLGVVVALDAAAHARTHQYLHLSGDGGETALLCDGCGYASLAAAAAFARPPVELEAMLPLERIATPHATTITDLARFLSVPESRTSKAVFLMVSVQEGEQFVFAVVRGDMGVSERKLVSALRGLGRHVTAVRPATDTEICAVGATPGYASPVGLKNVLTIVDELVAQSPNLVAGANEEGYHLLNTNYGRDFRATLVGDIAQARAGDGCPVCSKVLHEAPVAIIGQSQRMPVEKGGPTYLDATGRAQPVYICAHQVDLGALLTVIAEACRDDQGLTLPPAASPFAVHLVAMPGAETEVEALYRSLWGAGIECLWDDRGDSAGVKFTDADLIGLPLRITLGKRSLQAGGAEFKRRDSGQGGEKRIVPLDSAVEMARQMLADIEADIIAGAKEPPYGEHLR